MNEWYVIALLILLLWLMAGAGRRVSLEDIEQHEYEDLLNKQRTRRERLQ